MRGFRTEGICEIEAVHTGTEIDIQHDCIRIHLRPHAARISSIRGCSDHEARLGQGLGKQAKSQLVVLNDEHAPATADHGSIILC